MWIVYLKKDRTVVGMSALSDTDLDKEAALSEIVKGLAGGGSPDKYDAIQVKDVAEARALMAAPLQHMVISDASKGKPRASVEPPPFSALVLSCDATETHPVDGMPAIKADGKAFTTIHVRKVDERGEPRKSRTDNDELYLRATAGILRGADGKEAITSLKLKQGESSFRLVSEPARRVAAVSVFNGDRTVQDATIAVEFV